MVPHRWGQLTCHFEFISWFIIGFNTKPFFGVKAVLKIYVNYYVSWEIFALLHCDFFHHEWNTSIMSIMSIWNVFSTLPTVTMSCWYRNWWSFGGFDSSYLHVFTILIVFEYWSFVWLFFFFENNKSFTRASNLFLTLLIERLQLHNTFFLQIYLFKFNSRWLK